MSPKPDAALTPMVRKLERWSALQDLEREAVLDLPHVMRELSAGEYIVRDGDEPQSTCLLLSGFAYRHKLAGDGSRQIMSIHMRGDIVDLQNSLLGVADHNVQMLSAGTLAMIRVKEIRKIAASFLPLAWPCGTKRSSMNPSFGNGF